MLDGETPNIQVVTDGNDNINNEATVDADGHAKHAEHKGDLVHAVAEGTGPTRSPSNVLLEDGTDRVDDAKSQRDHEHVPVREAELDQVSRDHLADAVGVDKSAEDDEGNQMLGANHGLEIQVGHDQDPGSEEGDEALEGATAAVAPGTSRLDDVTGALDGVNDQHDGALDHVPLGEVEVVDEVRDTKGLGNTKGSQHRLLPEAGAAHEAGQSVDADQDQDTLDGSVHDAQGQGLGVILVPGLHVEGKQRGEEGRNRVPRLAHVLAAGKKESAERRVKGIHTVIEEFAKGATLVGSPAGGSEKY